MEPTSKKASKQVTIIGGGITGLSAAWYLQQNGGDHIELTILEKSQRWGGKVITQMINGPDGGEFTIDPGPESFITRKPEVWELAQELGITDQIIDPGSETKEIYILDSGRPVAVPLSPIAFLTSPLMTLQGKLRMLAEPFIPPKVDDEDESLADFADRRLGKEARKKFIGPVLAGIYNTNPETQSILTTSPIMREMEATYGGLFKGAFGRMKSARKAKKNGQPSRPRFITFTKGSEQIVSSLVQRLRGNLQLDAPVERVEVLGDQFEIHLAGGKKMIADAVIIATTANVTARLLADSTPEAAGELGSIVHTSIGTISLAYLKSDLTSLPLRGLMIPRREMRDIDAVTYTSAKLAVRAPEGCSLIRIFFGASNPDTVLMAEGQLLSVVKRELRELLGIQDEPFDFRISRWPEGFPQADVGHLDRVKVIEAALPAGLYVTGSSYRGIGVPDCVRQGRESAIKLLGVLRFGN